MTTHHDHGERHRMVSHGLQPLVTLRQQPDDDLVIDIRREIEWPMPRRKPVETTRRTLTEREVAEMTRALEQAIAEAVAEVDDGVGLGHG